MIDWNRVSELRLEIGADDFGEIVDIFLDEVEQTVDRLREGTAQKDLEGIMHFLKGSAMNLGFDEFATLCQKSEFAAAGKTQDTVDIGMVIACYEASRQDFLNGLNSRFAA